MVHTYFLFPPFKPELILYRFWKAILVSMLRNWLTLAAFVGLAEEAFASDLGFLFVTNIIAINGRSVYDVNSEANKNAYKIVCFIQTA